MANIELTAATNGGLAFDDTGDPDTLAVDASNMVAATDVSGTVRVPIFQGSDTPTPITLALFYGTLPDNTLIKNTGGDTGVEFDNPANAVEIHDELKAPDNYALTVAGTNADCYIDNAGRISPNTSSREVKENIRDLTDADVAKLKNLRPRKYQRIGQGPAEEMGLVAEEVYAVFPEACAMKSEEIEPVIRPNGTPKRQFRATNQPQGVNHSRLVVPLLRLVQSQAAEITAMKERLDALEV